MMPWTGRKLFLNPEPMGSAFAPVCLEALDRNPANIGLIVMSLLERGFGVASLQEALRAPVEGKKLWLMQILEKLNFNAAIYQ